MNKTRIFARIALLVLMGWILYSAGRELYDIAWGSGNWLGEFSPKWLMTFISFVLLSVAVWALAALALFWPNSLRPAAQRIIYVREKLGVFRWLLTGISLLALVIVLQYTPWGVVFKGFYLRLLIWSSVTTLTAILVARDHKKLASWPNILAAVLISTFLVTAASAFTNVTDYPFSLGWSEGNRLWDYSLLFGKDRYLYSGSPPQPLLDIGRELLGGLPFIFPNLTIFGARIWLAILAIVPYVVLGWIAFGLPSRGRGATKNALVFTLVGAAWAYIFIRQGPIHPPLMLCAILVAFAWRRPLWLAVPLLIFAGWFAQASRYTWMFAPAMWIGMLEFSSAALESNRGRAIEAWIRSISLTAAGLFGGVVIPIIQRLVSQSSNLIAAPTTNQPLLWYRLLPNATYGNGILLGLVLAASPLIAILIYLAASHVWKINVLQRLAIVGPLLAFLVVGLIVSTKIGGGGDLHNMDMFIIGLAFTAAVAWHKGGSQWLTRLPTAPRWAKAALVLLLAIPAVQPLMSLRPLEFNVSEPWLTILTDVEDPRFLGSLPDQQYVNEALDTINVEVNLAKTKGEVLFMDQRQLLTFGYVRDVPLVAEYEKKMLMNEALSGDAAYFAPFYEDLAAGRFSLIISEPLFTPIKDQDYVFGEENNAWVKWVSGPILCYYEQAERLREVRVELLVPRQGPQDCSALLPE